MARETAEFDVVIIGAGVAGLSAAIRLKQNAPDLSVVVLEKAAEVGAQVLSGAIIDPVGINSLFPDWHKDKTHPFTTPVKQDSMRFLTRKRGVFLPHIFMPSLLSNKGNYIVSLGAVCRWLAQKAEALGVDIFPGFAAKDAIYNENDALIGVITGDMGLNADGSPGQHYMPGMELRGKYVLLAEGARGSLTQDIIQHYNLNQDRDVQKYGLGIKELWQLDPALHKEGNVEHHLGWPLNSKATGGGFAYHMSEGKLALGLVVHLDYANPYVSPFEEFQQWKTHPSLKHILKGGKRLSYGARVINEGGAQSVPKLSFKGGALIGCAAGFVNLPRIKGSHNAILSSIAAADHVAEAIESGRENDEITEIETEWRQGTIGKDLKPVRNVKPLLERFGTIFGMSLGGLDMWCNQLFGFSIFGTLHHKKSDAETLRAAENYKEIKYPKADNIYSFDKVSSVYLANINAGENAPSHLIIKDKALQKDSEWRVFSGPSSRYCPAGVYEWQIEDAEGVLKEANATQEEIQSLKDNTVRFCVNAQNCVHCKTCDIKDPNNNIKWTVPEGGEGPIYPDM